MNTTIDWNKAIDTALTVKGNLGNTYNRFYTYSFTNQILLFMQGVTEPVATYKKWQELNRQVKKGSKAKMIIRPIFYKTDDEEEIELKGFKPVNCLFTVSDTDGADLPEVILPDWDLKTALDQLKIEQVAYKHTDGNTQGYSFNRSFAINPVAVNPVKTTMHELAHIVLNHTDKTSIYSDHKGIKEFQAECTAYLVLKELQTDFKEEVSRAYMQEWLQGEKPNEQAIKQVFKAVNDILTAGRKEQ